MAGKVPPEGGGGEGFTAALEDGVEGAALVVHELDADMKLVGGFAEGAEVVAGHVVEGGDVKLFLDAALDGVGGCSRREVEVPLVEGVVDFDENVLGFSVFIEGVVEADGVEDGGEEAGDGDQDDAVGLRIRKMGGQLLAKGAGAVEIIGGAEANGGAGTGAEAFDGLGDFWQLVEINGVEEDGIFKAMPRGVVACVHDGSAVDAAVHKLIPNCWAT